MIQLRERLASLQSRLEGCVSTVGELEVLIGECGRRLKECERWLVTHGKFADNQFITEQMKDYQVCALVDSSSSSTSSSSTSTSSSSSSSSSTYFSSSFSLLSCLASSSFDSSFPPPPPPPPPPAPPPIPAAAAAAAAGVSRQPATQGCRSHGETQLMSYSCKKRRDS